MHISSSLPEAKNLAGRYCISCNDDSCIKYGKKYWIEFKMYDPRHPLVNILALTAIHFGDLLINDSWTALQLCNSFSPQNEEHRTYFINCVVSQSRSTTVFSSEVELISDEVAEKLALRDVQEHYFLSDEKMFSCGTLFILFLNNCLFRPTMI